MRISGPALILLLREKAGLFVEMIIIRTAFETVEHGAEPDTERGGFGAIHPEIVMGRAIFYSDVLADIGGKGLRNGMDGRGGFRAEIIGAAGESSDCGKRFCNFAHVGDAAELLRAEGNAAFCRKNVLKEITFVRNTVIHPFSAEEDSVGAERKNALLHLQLFFGIEIAGRDHIFRIRPGKRAAAVHLVGTEADKLFALAAFGNSNGKKHVGEIRGLGVSLAGADIRDGGGVDDHIGIRGFDDSFYFSIGKTAERGQRLCIGIKLHELIADEAFGTGYSKLHKIHLTEKKKLRVIL